MENPNRNQASKPNIVYGLIVLANSKYFGTAVALFVLLGGFLNGVVMTQAAGCPAICGTTPGHYCYNNAQSACAASAACPPGGHPTYTNACTIPATGTGTAAPGASNVICAILSVYNTVVTVIFVLGIMLMILGGALYAGSQLLPGQSKGTLQGYGMGMILGGVIGLVIAVLAPFILNVIASNTVTGVVNGANGVAGGCPTT